AVFMRAAWRNLLARLRRLPGAEDGVAAVEFALVLPLMLMLYIGSVEGAALLSMDRRVQAVTGTLGDLVARTDTTTQQDTLDDYFRAAGAIMTPYPATDLHQVLSLVQVTAKGEASIVWSKRYDHLESGYTMAQGHPDGEA